MKNTKSYLEFEYLKIFRENKKFNGFYFGPLPTYRLALLFVIKRRRNIFLTLTDLTGAVLCSTASSFFEFSRKQRFSPKAFEFMLKEIEYNILKFHIYFVEMILRVKSKYFIKTIIHFLASKKINFSKAHIFLPRPFNGCRKKKIRRL
jgi:ribosomal protein S11